MRMRSGKCIEIMRCLVTGRSLFLLGILILYGSRGGDCHDLSHSSIFGIEDDGIEEDLVEECSMEFQSVNRFWNCLLSQAGIDPQREKEDIDPAKWGIRPVFPKVKVDSNGRTSPLQTPEKSSRGGGSSKLKVGDLNSNVGRTKGWSRRRRETGGSKKQGEKDNSESVGPYKPLTSSGVFEMYPDPDYYKLETDDPYHKSYPYLYTTDNQINQQPPPWSYHGNMPPKSWHNLDLEKFMVPVNKALNVEQASFAQLYEDDARLEFILSKRKGKKDQPRNIFSLWEEPLKNVTPMQYYYDANVKIHKGNTSVFVTNDYLKGHYTFTRFPLPLNYLDGLQSDIKRGLVPPPQELKPYSSLGEVSYSRTMRAMLLGFTKDKNIRGITAFKDLPDGPYKRLMIRAQQVLHPDHTGPPLPIPTLFKEMIAKGVELDELFKLVTSAMGKPELNPPFTEDDVVEEKRIRLEYSLPVLPKRYPICSNWEPSPLNIVTKNAVNSSLRPYSSNDLMYQLHHAHVEFPIDGTNLLMVTLGEPSSAHWGSGIELTGGAVKGAKLYFDRMFIHVGQDKNSGSEHRLDGKSYGMELQFLFTYVGNSEYKPFQFVLSQLTQNNFPYREKLVVMLSVLVEVKPKDTMTEDDQFRFEPLTQLISEYRKDRERAIGNHSYLHRTYSSEDYLIKLGNFIPLKGTFYTYRGSLTFPPCFEYIPWSIFEDTLQITEEQFLEFQLIPTEGRDDTGFLAGNSRQIEDIRVDDEIAPHVLPAEAEEMRKVREGRRVLRSLTVSTTDGKDEHYDYDFDYGNQAPYSHPLGGPFFLPSLAFLVAWMLQ